jgi:lysine 2,3-aminomutase
VSARGAAGNLRVVAPRSSAGAAEWDDWRWQAQHCIREAAALEDVLRLTADERRGLTVAAERFPISITPHYAALMDPDDPTCPVRMQAVPRAAEAVRMPFELRDPAAEDAHMPAPGLVHRYPDRALLLLNNMCPVYCRYCFRKRLTAEDNESLSREGLARAVAYLRAHPEVRDVILSGGEPLYATDARLADVLAMLRTVPSIEILRVHTRMPVVMPQRITGDLVRLLRDAAPLFVVTHFNHPKELCPDAVAACGRLVDGGVPVENQTVLLRRVNSSARILKELFHELLRARVRPYYLHQCDLAEGLEEFRTPVAQGIEILEQLQGWTSGLAIPRFVIDCPGGGGKVPIGPNYVTGFAPGEVLLRNYQQRPFRYPDPADADCVCPYDAKWLASAARGP